MNSYDIAINTRRICYLTIDKINKLPYDNDSKNIIIDILVSTLVRHQERDEKAKLDFQNWLRDEILKNKDETWLTSK